MVAQTYQCIRQWELHLNHDAIDLHAYGLIPVFYNLKMLQNVRRVRNAAKFASACRNQAFMNACDRIRRTDRYRSTLFRFQSTKNTLESDVMTAWKRGKECLDAPLDKIKAIEYFQIAAKGGIPDAQYQLGDLLLQNSEIAPNNVDEELLRDAETERIQLRHNDPKDIRSIRKQARLMHQKFQNESKTNQLSVQHFKSKDLNAVFGVEVPKLLDPNFSVSNLDVCGDSETRGIHWIRNAADQNLMIAQVRMGNICISQDTPLAKFALEWYGATLKQQIPVETIESKLQGDASYNIGMILYDSVSNSDPPLPQDRALSVRYFVKASELGDVAAQFFVGTLLFHGSKECQVAVNVPSGLMMIDTAANKGHTGAMFFLAQLYRSGDIEKNIIIDKVKFRYYLDAAVDRKDPDALFCLADMYYHGIDEEKDFNAAQQWYKEAAIAGNVDAFCCLGSIFYHGVGVTQDYHAAFQYYQQAADQNSRQAWKNLAEMHLFGRGVPENPELANSILKMLKDSDS
uniref:Uncharacterized protein AlNc14C118G6577 n=1 Tax=Albugo laibachii Nc14 TaxID=890382 RepID=F0WJ46_9STRA|nr:conserved hypothetical protein [Albugo laibachii Nc14]|eukprot:CCA21292.1 conserved hypothetical protein [Albugo laibachii Nc14]